ncbi:MAG: putative cation efflux system protein czcB [Myxococcaceae bacterium]|nr:putative cation efflux system protein czcB [Myxococcaceae bacterium]
MPAELCTQCNPDLAEVYKSQGDWCAEHGVPESLCLKCNPRRTFDPPGAAKDWCKEHAVPESKCTRCNPKLVARFIEAGDYCREHGFPKSVCPICNPELVKAAGEEPPTFATEGTRVRLASADTAREAGIQTVRLTPQRFAQSVDVTGRLGFNQDRLAQLSSPGDALVLEVQVDVGQEVTAGQSLLALASSQVGAAQARAQSATARLAAAEAAVAREEKLRASGVSSARDVDEAQRVLSETKAEQASALAAIRAAGGGARLGSDGRYLLTAPFPGVVVSRDAISGRTAAAGQILVSVADPAILWALLDVPEADAPSVRPGQRVNFVFDGLRGEKREGKVGLISPVVDAQSRTVRVRVDLPNPDRSLRAGTFFRAQLEVAAAHQALLVPREAVQRAQGRPLVFVRKSNALFEPVSVELGAGNDQQVEIVRGLSAGDEVVTTGAFLLKTEILKDSIGAGCCDEGEGK